MKQVILFAIIFFTVISSVNAFKRSNLKQPDNIVQTLGDTNNVKIETMTKERLLYNWNALLSIKFAKGDGKFYLIFSYSYNPNIELLENNSLDLKMSNGEKIQIFPFRNSIREDYKSSGLLVYSKGEETMNTGKLGATTISSSGTICHYLYQISKDQLQKFSENKVEVVNIYYSSKKDVKSKMVDQDGKYFFQYKTGSLASGILKRHAKCMLNE